MLVIIGLIVGGVLVGQDLIKAAELRGSISQLSKYNTAVNTFRTKYGYLPGDIPQSIAGSFGLFQMTATCTTPCRFGNGLIDSSSAGGGVVAMWEHYVFWRHLGEAGFVEGKPGTDSTYPLRVQNGMQTSGFAQAGDEGFARPTTMNIMQYALLPSKQNGFFWHISQSIRSSPVNGSTTVLTSHDYYLYSEMTALAPLLAHAFDQKLDDGVPNTGVVVDLYGAFGSWSASPNANGWECTHGGAAEYSPDTRYLLDPNNGGNNEGCGMRFKAGF